MNLSTLVLGQIFNLSLALLDSEGKPRHRYFHTNFNFRTQPYTKIPVYLESFDKKTKTFSILVLTDRKRFNVGIDYPLVPITEDQAQEIVNQRMKGKTPVSIKSMQLTNNQPALPTPAPALGITTPTPPEPQHGANCIAHTIPGTCDCGLDDTPHPGPAVAPKKKKEVKRDGRESMSTLILAGLAEKTFSEIVDQISAIYPERDPKKIRSLISCHKSRIKWHREHPEAK